MRRPWEKFAVTPGMLDVEYVDVIRRGRGYMIVELATAQKYPQILTTSGVELCLMSSEHTPERQKNGSNEATSVMFPRSVRGWQVVSEFTGRYTLRFALYKEPRRPRHRDVMVRISEEKRRATYRRDIW